MNSLPPSVFYVIAEPVAPLELLCRLRINEDMMYRYALPTVVRTVTYYSVYRELTL